MQNPAEIEAVCQLFAREGVQSFLEIGSKYGGSLWQISRVLPKGARIVSVDLASPATVASLTHCLRTLRGEGFDVHHFAADSTDPQVISAVTALAPFDLVFIDADHTLAGVTADWENYGPLGKMVAFHDIAWRRAPEWDGLRLEVPLLWNVIKDSYRHSEYKMEPKAKSNGIGVLWRG